MREQAKARTAPSPPATVLAASHARLAGAYFHLRPTWLWIRRMANSSAKWTSGRAVLAVLAACAGSAEGQARAGEVALTCTNPISGASWRIMVDYEQATVDSNPARVSDSEISWRDAKDGWRYTLDRKSGKLTVVLASATGGNFLYDQCSPGN